MMKHDERGTDVCEAMVQAYPSVCCDGLLASGILSASDDAPDMMVYYKCTGMNGR